MSIKDEFKKMLDDSTNPIEAINEVYGYKNGRLSWEDNPAPIDVETVPTEADPGVYVPSSIINPEQNKLMPIISAFRNADNQAKIEFTKKLVSQYINNDKSREGFKDMLRSCGLVVESVIMPPEQMQLPEPTIETSNQEEAPKTFRQKVEELNAEIEAKKGSGEQEKEKAYDDITSAFAIVLHHLDDIDTDELGQGQPAEF